MRKFNIAVSSNNLKLIEPVSYQEMIVLEKHARSIITDSGGVQKEAYFAGVPCIVLRGETEWVELVENGWAVLVGDQFEKLPETITGLSTFKTMADKLFGDGHASRKIVEILKL
ncbi:MAG: UDP-N-acetylglucosamine 2-epimerase, partial [Candidatus Marinimicrobia bacterium]|nr:UDP-N-acetylglucosamine 2-epimerase [Candidatus Neomarinimicrobiota bacterium]